MSKAAQERHWRMHDKAKFDKGQAKFGESMELKMPEGVKTELSQIPMDKLCLCPFCLTENRLQTFLVSSKEGISHTKAHCKFCGSGMMMRNLLRDWTAEDYALWVFNYRKSGFFEKIKAPPNSFEAWRRRLTELGWSQAFWLKYKELKAQEKPWEETDIKRSDYFVEDDS